MQGVGVSIDLKGRSVGVVGHFHGGAILPERSRVTEVGNNHLPAPPRDRNVHLRIPGENGGLGCNTSPGG